jgi:lipopolysaccharide export system protein LptA
MGVRRSALLLQVLGASVLAATASAQQQPAAPSGQCQLQFESNPKARLNLVKLPSGEYNYFIGGGVTAHCPAQNMTLVADSGESFGDRHVVHLIGNVHYTEPRLKLDSRELTYFMLEERLVAVGNVHATLPSGTTMQGPRAEYFRAAPGIRDQPKMIAPGRPTIKLIQHDTTGKPAEPVTVIANTVTTQADSLVYASGRVEITRPDVVARGDSAYMDSGREFARLMKKPTIHARGDRPFTLYGTVIDLFAHDRLLNRVLSKDSAKAVSQDATITSDTLVFLMADGRLQQAFAWGASRAHATSPTYDIRADSLDVMMPDQRLHEVHALRDALAESVPDTTRIRSTARDRLWGDTIFAFFDTTAKAAPKDTSQQPRIERLIARGHARSFYQIAPRDTATGPAINYVRGRDITVAFANRSVTTVTITDQAAGVYLEPTPPAPDTAAKSRAAQSDSSRASKTSAKEPPARRGKPHDE